MATYPRSRGPAALALVLSCALLPAGASAQAPALPPIEKFFANPALDQVRLSPKGRYVAMLTGAPGRRDVLAVVDLAAGSIKMVAGYKDFDVLRFEWVNDDRLMYSVGDSRIGAGAQYQASGLFAVNRDGANPRQLAGRHAEEFMVAQGGRLNQTMLPWHTFMTGQRGPQDSDYAYVESYDYDPGTGELLTVDLLRLNTVTGQARAVPRPSHVKDWLLDNAGEPRIALSAEGETTTVHYRDPATAQWRRLASFHSYTGAAGAFIPVGFDGDGRLYVEANAGKDTSALYHYDLKTGQLAAEPLLVAKGYDFDGALVSRRGKLLGARLHTDAVSDVWFDPAMQALQQKVDALLPGMVNLITPPANAEPLWVLINSYSDVRPSTYVLYNTQTGELNRIGEAFPGIDAARMGRQQPVRYTARDGRGIPGLLTLPPGGGKNLPLVVLVHGGPYMRGSSWGWNPESQFLASRGYAVLEPEFRGSQGYGQAHYRAGWKQWGMAMQDDIADGARWAVAQGHADPKRICIAGASYGGYATLMGLAKDGDLYRCGISWAGVTDIDLLYGGQWSFADDLPDDYKKYGMPELIGDRVKDAAQLTATSPIRQAARITQPLLLAHGAVDRRVTISHGTRFRDALKRTNQQVEWIEYAEEGHGWRAPATRVDFWGRVEKFLDRHIGRDAAR